MAARKRAGNDIWMRGRKVDGAVKMKRGFYGSAGRKRKFGALKMRHHPRGKGRGRK